VNQAPLVLSGHRVDVALAQEALILEALQFLDLARVTFGFCHKKLDGALVLFAAIDQRLLLIALRLHGNARNFHIQGDAHDGGHQEDQQQGKAPFVLSTLTPFHRRPPRFSRSVRV
jgi:hypothetical protein